MKVVTLVRGKVPRVQRAEFESAYRALKNEPSSRPQGLETSLLLKKADGEGTYTIQTIWASREALEAMRGSGKPKAVELFEEVAKVTPEEVEIHEVVETLP